jgi:hypothetical protein
MAFTLMSNATPLGRTGIELTGLQPGARAWHFQPAPAFETVSPLLMALQEATLGLQELMPTTETLATVREAEREAFVRNAIMSDPGAARFLELMDDVEALGLELHDERGALVPTLTLGVTELELTPDAFRELLHTVDPNADARLSATPPFYLLVAGVR